MNLPETEPLSILLVDDDPFFLGTQLKLLHRLGYADVATAASAEAAMHVLQHRTPPISVIFCDLNMPRIDGIEFLQMVAGTAFDGHVVVQSGQGVRIMHSVRKLLEKSRLKFSGTVEKPASSSELRRLLEASRTSHAAAVPLAKCAIEPSEIINATQRGEWRLHYQPKVDLQTAGVVGVEALLRWQHPMHGLLYPDSFIERAEDCGAIDGVTDWVLREALRQMDAWVLEGRALPVAVNVSMENLRRRDFVPRLSEQIGASAISACDLTLEITESRIMSATLEPLESLVRLRMQRFSLSIDDFGTGHSSLAQLRDVPFSELKIDRGFVHGARTNEVIRPILEGSVGIARRLGMRSVAEGVETEDDWRLLQEIGCDVAQGWFIGRPLEPEHMTDWLVEWRARQKSLAVCEQGGVESALARFT